MLKTKNGNISYLFPIRVRSWPDRHKSPCLIKNQNKTLFGWFPLVSGCCFSPTDLFFCCCTFHLFFFHWLHVTDLTQLLSHTVPHTAPLVYFTPLSFSTVPMRQHFPIWTFPQHIGGQSTRLATFPSANYASWTHLILFFSWCWQSWVPLFSCACNLDHSTKSQALAVLSSRMK